MSRKEFLIFSLFIILVGSGSEGETNFGIRHNWADSQGSGSASESLHCPAHLGQEDVELEAGHDLNGNAGEGLNPEVRVV